MARPFGQLELVITRGAAGALVAGFSFRLVSGDGRTLKRVQLGRAALHLAPDDPGMESPYAALQRALEALSEGRDATPPAASSPAGGVAAPQGPRGGLHTPGGS